MSNLDTGVPGNIAEMMVAIGRIEEKLTRIEKIENRLTAMETLVTHLDATKPVKTTFVNIVSAIAASVAIVLGFTNLSIIQENRTNANVQLELLKKNQDQIIQKVNP